MTRTLLVAPHADDESLFASYLAQRYAAHIVAVYDEGREKEFAKATVWLGCSFAQGPLAKGASENEVVDFFLTFTRKWDRLIVPDVEEFGHEEHNLVGRLALEVLAESIPEVIRYRTYSPRGTRSHGTSVEPDRSEMIARKLAAMSCYRSQILDESTRPWFYDLLDMREWTA